MSNFFSYVVERERKWWRKDAARRFEFHHDVFFDSAKYKSGIAVKGLPDDLAVKIICDLRSAAFST